MNTVLIIARLTFREAIRRRIVLAALLLGIAFLAIFSLGFHFINQDLMQEQPGGRIPVEAIRNQAFNFMALAGLYVVNFLSIAIAALITADSLAGEIQSGTIQSIVTKPIRRCAVVLGKWLGHATLLLFYLAMLAGGVILSVRIISGYLVPGWLPGIVLMYFTGLIIMTLTLAFSSSFSTLATGGAVFGAFGLAFIGGWVERIGTLLDNQTAMDLGILSSLLLPTEAMWNKASALMTSPLSSLVGVTPFSTGSEPSVLMIAYAVLYMAAALFAAIHIFRKRDL